MIVATDDQRIFAAVREFGGRPVMTRADHPSGTDRVAEVAAHLDADVVVNLQGDEPQLDPAAIDLLADLMRDPGVRHGDARRADTDARAVLQPERA